MQEVRYSDAGAEVSIANFNLTTYTILLFMAYQYDVFLSYNRKFPHGEWVTETFLPFFQSYLEDALNKSDVKIFIDQEEIKAGNAWDAKIKNALIHSRIMVAIFSPAYFRSEWCKKELAVIDYRQRQLGYLSVANPNGLIVPVQLFDGEHYPKYAFDLQMADLRNYNRIGLGRNHQLYIDLQEELQDFAKKVADAYNNAPVWDDEWKQDHWITKSWDDMDRLNGSLSNKPPTL